MCRHHIFLIEPIIPALAYKFVYVRKYNIDKCSCDILFFQLVILEEDLS